MSKYLLVLCAMALSPSAWSGWVFLTNNSHGANDYYYAPVEDKGKVKVLRTFTQLAVDAKVPFHTPKAVVKVMLYNYTSEQSTYEINCQEQSIHLIERIFYRDMSDFLDMRLLQYDLCAKKMVPKRLEENSSYFYLLFFNNKIV